MKLTTTLRLCKDHRACHESWNKLANHFNHDMNKMIFISDIIHILNIQDAIWALRAVPEIQTEDSKKIARLFACDCAEHVLPFFEKENPNDNRPRECIKITRLFINGKVSFEEFSKAAQAAWAAEAAAQAAWAAAAKAAWVIEAAAIKWQAKKLSEYLK